MEASQLFDIIFKATDLDRLLWCNAVKLVIFKCGIDIIATMIVYFRPIDAFFGKNRVIFVLPMIKCLDQGTGKLWSVLLKKWRTL